MEHRIDLAAPNQMDAQRRQHAAGRRPEADRLIGGPAAIEIADRPPDRMHHGLAVGILFRPGQAYPRADRQDPFHHRGRERLARLRPDLSEGGDGHLDAVAAGKARAEPAAQAEAVGDDGFQISGAAQD